MMNRVPFDRWGGAAAAKEEVTTRVRRRIGAAGEGETAGRRRHRGGREGIGRGSKKAGIERVERSHRIGGRKNRLGEDLAVEVKTKAR